MQSSWLSETVSRVPAGPEALDLLDSACDVAIAHHAARTLRYALAIAEREVVDVDGDALVHACLLDDIAASALVTGWERFEVQGADIATRFLESHDWAPARREAVWAAIALHTTPHIAERLSSLTRLVRLGVLTDFGADLVDPVVRAAAEADLPRLDVERVLTAVVVEQAVADERRAPASSWPGRLLAAHRSSPDPDARLSGF